ncbi:MAG: prolyl-tRNA synthetase associated domain-containing protein [Sphingorhabdus sp.]
MSSEDRLFADLAALNIDWQLVEHEAVFTVEESAKQVRDIPGAHTKNLFLKDAGGKFWLVTVPAEMRVDLKALPQAIECKRVSFASAEEMLSVIGVTPGSVTPLASIYDTAGLVTIALDETLVRSDRINVHPLRNTATIGLSPSDLIRLLRQWRHDPVIATIPPKDATPNLERF